MLGNGIKQTTATTGTGNLTLAAVAGFPTLANVFAVGQPFSYALLTDAGLFLESGIGYLSDATTMVRASVDATFSGTYNSINPTPLSLTGTTTVICTPHAATMITPLPTVDAVSTGVGRFIASSGSTNLRGTHLMTAGAMYYIPFHLDAGVVASSMAVNVATAAAGTAKLGIYSCTHQAYPGKLLVSTADFDVGTTGFKNPALASNVFLSAGAYFAAVYSSSACTFTAVDGASYNTQAGPNPFGFNGASFSTIQFRFVTSASFPADAPTATTAASSGIHIPAILIGVV